MAAAGVMLVGGRLTPGAPLALQDGPFQIQEQDVFVFVCGRALGVRMNENDYLLLMD